MTCSWIEKAVPEIFESLSFEERGSPPSFPLEQVIANIKAALSLEDFSISIKKMDFIDANNFYKGLDKKTLSTPLSLSAIDGIFTFVMGLKDIQTLISSMEKENKEAFAISNENESVVKGVFTYFITEAIDSIAQTKVYSELSLKISEGNIQEFSAYAIDLSIQVEGTLLPARILFPKTYYKALQDYFTFIPPTLENLENIPDAKIPISIRTGSASLSTEELENIEEGDFIILHNSFYKPSAKKGSFQMLIGKNPIFQVKMQKDGMKILDYLYFYDEEAMEDNKEEENPLKQEPLAIEDELDQDLFEEDISEELASPEKTNLSNVHLTMNMEIARFSLTLEALKKLSPGHKLPVSINPKQVNLVIGGKSVGIGEIIEIGETIGVKITKLYK